MDRGKRTVLEQQRRRGVAAEVGVRWVRRGITGVLERGSQQNGPALQGDYVHIALLRGEGRVRLSPQECTEQSTEEDQLMRHGV